MTSPLLWTLIALQIGMGAFDTLYHHEFTERLAWRASQRYELRLHAIRNWFYAVMFLALGWFELHGAFGVAMLALLAIEIVITLMDFVEEDMSRKLPPTERINHTLLAINYGGILVLLIPVLLAWTAAQSALVPVTYGVWSGLATVAAAGVAVFGVRDFLASGRCLRLNVGAAAPLVSAMPQRKTVLVTGATGFIGRRVVEALVLGGHDVVALVRNPNPVELQARPIRLLTSLAQIADDTRIDAIINLAGEPIANGWWTVDKRRRIVASRVDMTNAVVALIARLQFKPEVLVSGSAIGWYGLQGDAPLDETSVGQGCFSREVCVAWEGAAAQAQVHGVRVAMFRLGLVVGTEGGFLTRMLTPFEFGLGGPMGSGQQWMSWIERDDVVRLIAHVIATPAIEGAINATAPAPVTNAAFARALGAALHRPAVVAAPARALEILGGDLARELLLGGQRVLPAAALASGFRFQYPKLPEALAAILGAKTAPMAPVVDTGMCAGKSSAARGA